MEDEDEDLWDKVKPVAGTFPPAAFAFVASGLAHTVRTVHGDIVADSLDMYSVSESEDNQGDERSGDGGGAGEAAPANGKVGGEDDPHGTGGAKSAKDRVRHVNGQQLCLGLREYAINRYGKMACVVLKHMNIHTTDDFGRIVFAMIEAKQMSRSEGDKFEDFCNVFNFTDAFGS